jgi:hypothetical protein
MYKKGYTDYCRVCPCIRKRSVDYHFKIFAAFVAFQEIFQLRYYRKKIACESFNGCLKNIDRGEDILILQGKRVASELLASGKRMIKLKSIKYRGWMHGVVSHGFKGIQSWLQCRSMGRWTIELYGLLELNELAFERRFCIDKPP